MTLGIPRSAAALVFLALANACSSESANIVTSPEALSSRAFSSAPFELSSATIQVRTGTTHQLEATKSANGKAVPDPSISWSSLNPSIATISSTGLVSGVAQGTTTVSATRGSHQLDVAVTVVCGINPLLVGITTGTISTDDCLFTVAGRRSDYYSVAAAQGEIIGINATGVDGISGIKAEAADPAVGTVYGSRNIGARYRVIGNGDPLQFFISGRDSTKLGPYTITRSVDTQSHSCNQLTFVVPGASFNGNLSPATSCVFNVQFSPLPQAIGKPLNTHRYWVRLAAAKPYTVTISGLTNSFDPAVSIFPNIANAGPVAQSIPGPLPAPASRSVTFTPSAEGYYLIEIASGRFVDNLITWVVQSGSYSLSVSR